MTDFATRCAAVGVDLTVKPKKKVKPMSEQPDHQLIATIKNPMVLDETRERALKELESRQKTTKVDAPK